MLKIDLERLSDILLTEPESLETGNELEPNKTTNVLEIKHLYFKYSDSEPYILQDINIKIPLNQSVAIIGATGCGKNNFIKF